jgi:hypothetical protein
VIRSFLLGAIVGGAAVWCYKDEIREYVDDMTAGFRDRAASGLEQAAERLQTAADTVEGGLAPHQRLG